MIPDLKIDNQNSHYCSCLIPSSLNHLIRLHQRPLRNRNTDLLRWSRCAMTMFVLLRNRGRGGPAGILLQQQANRKSVYLSEKSFLTAALLMSRATTQWPM